AMAGVNQQPQAYQNFQQAYEAFGGRGLLLGEPGAGKTTTLFAFARELIVRRLDDPTQPLPILAPIATWDAVQQPGLIEWLAAQIPVFTIDELTRLMTQDQALLLLDGLDELGAEREEPKTKERYDPRLRFIQRLEADLTVGRVIVTCRIKDYGELDTKIALKGAARLQPLDDAQMQAYLREMPALWEALQADADLRAIARTPLLLSLFTAAYREATPDELQQLRDLRASPGDVRAKIFEMFVRKSYEREARKPYGALKFSLDEVNTLLSELGANDLSRKNGAPHLIPTKLVKQVLKQETRIRDLVDLTARLYLFVQHNRAHYGFIHLMLRDYYAYSYAQGQLQHARSDDERYQALTTFRLLQDDRTVTIFMRFLQYPQPKIQLLAAAALAELKDRSAVEALIGALRDPDVSVRRGAVTALGWLKDQGAAPAILDLAYRDGDPWLQMLAATALRRLHHGAAFDLFSEALTSTYYEVRQYAAGELGRVGDSRAVELLMVLLNDSSRKVQRIAERALRQLGTPEALEAADAWQQRQPAK
ncbi:MAG: HEAT repeat domain-containing protein, partial [Anaerolineae bacterium]|nr:HEAT repeat domain-containing protein [Anaerolineae bacterium]